MSSAAGEMSARRKARCDNLLLIAIMVFGITAAVTAAQAQTASDQTTSGGTGVGSDPLSVPTSSLSTGSSFSTGSTGSGATGSNGASGISASSSNTSQVPLQLSGETPNTSTQAATFSSGCGRKPRVKHDLPAFGSDFGRRLSQSDRHGRRLAQRMLSRLVK